MKTYARIQDGRVMEMLVTAADLNGRYHPSLQWVDATGIAGVAVGWNYDGVHWTPPLPVSPSGSSSLAELQSQLALLTAQVAQLLHPVAEDASDNVTPH